MKYYVTAYNHYPNGKDKPGFTEIGIKDNPNGYDVLLEIEAPNYETALKQVTFIKRQNGDCKTL